MKTTTSPVEQALCKINEAEGWLVPLSDSITAADGALLLAEFARGVRLLGEGKALLELVVDGEQPAGQPQLVVIPMPSGLDFRNGGQTCDTLQGPCACGAWHPLRDLPFRIAHQLMEMEPVQKKGERCVKCGSTLAEDAHEFGFRDHAFVSPTKSTARIYTREPVGEWPRRADMNRWHPAERAIQDAVQVVEEMGADVRLTDAVVLLGQARAKVADFIDKK